MKGGSILAKFKIIFPLICLILFILGANNFTESSSNGPSTTDYVQAQLLGINDFHGQLDKYQNVVGTKAGGAEYLAAYLKKYRNQNENTLLVHAGDMVGGSPPISSLFQDEPTIEFLDHLNFDIGTPGNHELDEGVDEMKRLIHGGFHEKTGLFLGSKTSYTSANIIDKKTGNPLFPPYIIKNIDGIDIGFIGVVTTETKLFVFPKNLEEIEITDEVEAINQTVEILKKKGIRSIVVLAHVSVKSDWTGTNPEGALIDMVPRIDDEVDVIFAGHSHQYTNTLVDGKLIVQAYSNGKAFSHVNLKIDRVTKDIVEKEADIIITSHHLIEPDQKTVEFLKKYKEKAADFSNSIIGEIPQAYSRKQDGNGESPLAQIIAESAKASMNTDIAMFHHGGIRASLKKGAVTKEDLYTALPFEHSLVKLSLTGGQLKEVLEQQWTEEKENRLQIVGLTYSWDPKAPIGSRIIAMKDHEGRELHENKEYKVAVSDYLASGGDGFTELKNGSLVESGPLMVNALADYINKQYPFQVARK